MNYRRRASPLHAARAAAAICWCGALAIAALLSSNPLWLGCVTLVVLCAAVLAGAGGTMRRCLRFALPLGLAVCLINALVTRQGLTVIWRLGDLPLLGQTDITAEAAMAGAMLGLRAVALVALATLYSVAVDPDEVLALLRRTSFSSALSATVATRMLPVLLADSRRIADAQRCRSGPRPARLQLLRASTAGVLDRALDVAATLEVRGYGLSAARGARRGRSVSAWSRQDLGFGASALAILGLAVLARVSGALGFSAYPLVSVSAGAMTVGAAVLLALSALAPFTCRRGVAR